MDTLKDTTVLVLGLGESGLAMARWCARCGARVRVWDSRDEPPQAAALAAQLPSAQRLRGELCGDALDGVQRVLKSPGLAPSDPKIAALLKQAAANGIAVEGELDLFAAALASLKAEHGYAPKVIAITGTNGKTTTTALTALLVERCGRRVAAAGNIGPTMLQTLADALDLEDEALPSAGHAEAEPPSFEHLPEVWVLELSSFQLAGAKAFEPTGATVLNITQDHLDWHGSMADYVAAKANAFGRAGVMVVNRDDALVEALVPAPVLVKTTKTKRTFSEREVVRFGLDAPKRPGDWGLVVEGGMAWLVRALEADETARRAKPGDAPEEIYLQRLMPADALRLRGRHNAANALAALALATSIGCPLAPMLHGLREYEGEPHRVQFVATLDGVDAFDDSKGTNVGATVAALLGLGAEKAPGRLVVILGGDAKGQDFAPLVEPLRRHARAIATIGRDAAMIETALAATGVTTLRHDSLEQATAWCFAAAHPGDAVLLSPACASLDMFRNYGHRAAVFVAAVRALMAGRGVLVA